MATVLLAVGSTAASSTGQTLQKDESVRLLLRPVAGQPLYPGSWVDVELEDSDSNWIAVGRLQAKFVGDLVAADLDGPCNYRVTRPALASEYSCGVDEA